MMAWLCDKVPISEHTYWMSGRAYISKCFDTSRASPLACQGLDFLDATIPPDHAFESRENHADASVEERIFTIGHFSSV